MKTLENVNFQVQAAVLDLAKFGKVVKLESFLPFKSGANALENINSISEGKVKQYYTIPSRL